MMDIRFSLCIPTIDRFDEFLDGYLEIYLDLLKSGLLDEIIVCDENGNDYNKILQKYNGGNLEGPIKIYKNITTLGAFKNKLRAASYAKPGNFVAVIDSDNLVDRDYFLAAHRFIVNNCLKPTDDIVLSPYHTISDFEFDFSKFLGQTIDYLKARKYANDSSFHMLLNNGNYIITKGVYEKITYQDEHVDHAGPHDVLYKHLLSFQQNPNYRLYVVEDMKYVHVVHINSLYLQTHQASLSFYNNTILPQFNHL